MSLGLYSPRIERAARSCDAFRKSDNVKLSSGFASSIKHDTLCLTNLQHLKSGQDAG